MFPHKNPMYGQTPSTEVLNARYAAAMAERNPSYVTPPTPADIQPTPAGHFGQPPCMVVVKPLQDEQRAYEAALLAQAKDRGLKGVAYVLEQKAGEEERKKRLTQFYCAHTYVNVPVQWYGATVYPRICPKCGHIRSSDYAK
jgi:hypothetical protein